MVFAVLSLIAVAGFAGVTRLTNRYGEQQKALARRMYARGLNDQKDGHPDRSIEDFRSALGYDRDNFQYQLSLARALRDTGRTREAEAYLVNLWERSPQDGFVNLALGRLASRQGQVEKAIQYYHNAAYGVWPSNAEVNRRNAEFELIDFLLRRGAHAQAEAELLALCATLPADADLRTHVAQLFAQLGKYERALALFDAALRLNPTLPEALAGAGNAAFQLARYRAAEKYLKHAVSANPSDAGSKDLLQTSSLILQMDPFVRHLRSSERIRRLRAAFDTAGKRLNICLTGADADSPQGSSLLSLKSNWIQMKTRLSHMTNAEGDTSDAAMDLISEIEQQVQLQCGAGGPSDRALLLLAKARQGADQ
jgi:tetratricopeptide (TPR) repeat protein